MPRSRRDDNYVRGRSMPPKQPGVGVVVSRQGDTITVLVLDEELPGVIPLGKLPPVDAIVEIEARGDLTVALDWTDADDQPQLGDWYFTAAESPDWAEGQADSELGVGEHVSNPAPDGAGILWNRADFDVQPGDTLTFTMLVSKLDGVDTTVRMVLCWAEHGVDPQPSNGEVVAYGPTVTVDVELEEFKASATVPGSFAKPGGGTGTPGRARLGLRYTPVGA